MTLRSLTRRALLASSIALAAGLAFVLCLVLRPSMMRYALARPNPATVVKPRISYYVVGKYK